MRLICPYCGKKSDPKNWPPLLKPSKPECLECNVYNIMVGVMISNLLAEKLEKAAKEAINAETHT